jgi:hypothetical protein
MFAEKPSRADFNGRRPVALAAQKLIIGDEFKVPEARRAWPRF